MKLRMFVAMFLLAANVLVLPGCGNTPDPLPAVDTATMDDLMEDMVVPPVEQ